MHKKVMGSIPGKGTYLGCKYSPWSGTLQRQPIYISPPHTLSLSSLSFLKSINMSSGEDFFFKWNGSNTDVYIQLDGPVSR